MAKKRQYTAAQLANDPSLRWVPYRQWELVYSDTHQDCRRFYAYEGEGMVRLGTLMLGVIDGPEGLVPETSVRRPGGGVGHSKPQTASGLTTFHAACDAARKVMRPS